MPVRLGVHYGQKNVQGKNANTEEDNNDNGAKQPLTIEVRLEQRPEKTCYRKPLEQKKSRKFYGLNLRK